MLAQYLGELNAVKVRHLHVHQHQVGAKLQQALQRLHRVADQRGPKPGALQQRRVVLPDLHIILNDRNPADINRARFAATDELLQQLGQGRDVHRFGEEGIRPRIHGPLPGPHIRALR